MDSGLISINPFTQLENANMVVFAKLDSEKSVFLKTATSCLLSTCNIYVIDHEGQYQHFCEKVKGQGVRFSADSLQINPFELYAVTGTVEKIVVDENVKNEKNSFSVKSF